MEEPIETIVGVVAGAGSGYGFGSGSGTEYFVWMDKSVKLTETGKILYNLGPCKIYLVYGQKPPESGMVGRFTGEVSFPLEPFRPFCMQNATWEPEPENLKMSEQKIDATIAFNLPSGIQGLALLKLVDSAGKPLDDKQTEIAYKFIAAAIKSAGAEIYDEMTGPGDSSDY
jgi:hypothetical protein